MNEIKETNGLTIEQELERHKRWLEDLRIRHDELKKNYDELRKDYNEMQLKKLEYYGNLKELKKDLARYFELSKIYHSALWLTMSFQEKQELYQLQNKYHKAVK